MYVKVRVFAGMKSESVTKVSKDMFEIRVREDARQNKANSRMIELLMREYGSLVRNIRIVTGHHTPTKIVDVVLKD